MTPRTLYDTRKRLGLSQAALAARLGLAVRTVACYEDGAWPDGRPAPIPPTVALAMRAIEAGLDG